MAETELHPAAVSLEDSGEVVGANLVVPETPAVETKPAETPAPAADPDDAEPDGTIEATGGVKFVPLDAVKAERGRRKEAEKVAKEKDALIEQLKVKAEQFDQAAVYLDQAKPIIETLKQRPDLVALAKNPPARQEPQGPLTQDEAVEMARDLDLYKADGSPDIDRAQKIAKRQEVLADRKAQQAVQPFHQQNALQQSEFNRRAILNLKDAQGNALVDPAALNSVWNIIDPAESSKPEVATTLYRLALGLMAEKGISAKPAPPPPLVTESLSSSKPGSENLSATGEAFLRASGLSRKDYMALRDEYKPGQTTVLE